MAFVVLFLCLNALHLVLAKGAETLVECTPELMKVMVPMDGLIKTPYLDQMKEYKPCKPKMKDGMAMFDLNLNDPYKCGVTRVLNKKTGKKTFYHKIVIEGSDAGPQTVTVKCSILPPRPIHSIDKRQIIEPAELPLDFHEPDVVTITRVEESHAPEPVLGIAVRENGRKVSGELSVKPGTPLAMEIFLDNSSAPVYGLFVNYMQVTDTGSQLQTIILNGCSIDAYVFDNFLTEDGDILTAKFKAFKFPESNIVQFNGTVTVCLDKCPGVECSNGITGYGRRRRSVTPEDNLFEVSFATIIQVSDDKGNSDDILEQFKKLKVRNQMLEDKDGTPATVAEKTPDNRLILVRPTDSLTAVSRSTTTQSTILVLFAFVIVFFK